MSEPPRQIDGGEAGAVAAAARCLALGGLVAFPTETVYGLGADATRAEAVARVFQAKARPSFNPLISHLATAVAALALARSCPLAEQLAARFWPGPLTLVLPRAADCLVDPLACAGLDTVALRVPAHPLAHDLLAAFGGPVVAPSANRSGALSPTRAAHVVDGLGGGQIDLVLDGGACSLGIESTVVAVTDGGTTLLRPGALAVEAIEAETGPLVRPAADPAPPSAPGQLASHYAPRLPLRLGAREVGADEALLAFGLAVPEGALATRNLSPAGDLMEAAANLFHMLHELDASGAHAIVAMAVPEEGLGLAINDRLRRAAAPRPC